MKDKCYLKDINAKISEREMRLSRKYLKRCSFKNDMSLKSHVKCMQWAKTNNFQ